MKAVLLDRIRSKSSAIAVVGLGYVGALFGGSVVAWLISDALHVESVTSVVTTDPTYRARLSPRSIVTLEAQGGLMDDTGVAALGAAPDLDALLALRRADDDAKVPDAKVPTLDHWHPLLFSAR